MFFFLLFVSSSGQFEVVSVSYCFQKISNTCTLLNIPKVGNNKNSQSHTKLIRRVIRYSLFASFLENIVRRSITFEELRKVMNLIFVHENKT